MAANGINVKMGVEGLSQFKNNMKTAQTSVKTLDQQLKANEAQFKATGDAEAYMEQKTQLLELKLKEQKTTVTNAEKALEAMREKGIDPANASYQKLAQEMLKAKAGMYETEAALNEIGEAGDVAADGVNSMNSQLKRVGDGVSWQNVTDGIDTITAGLEKVAKKAYSVGKAIVKEVLGTGGWADDINTRSKVLGVSTEDLQRMEKTARIIDTDAETIIKARQKLMKNVGTGKSDTMTALEALGISYNGNAEDAFWKAGEAIMALGDEAEQEAKANAIFGRSWHDLIPLFSAGREEYERINGTWNVMSQEQLDALNQMDDEYQKLQIAVEDLKREALSNLAVPMKEILTQINELLGKIGEWLKSDEGKATVDNVVTTITDSLKWIMDNKDGAIAALGAIVTGWGTLKLTGAAADMLKLLNGLKGLTGGKTVGTAVGSKLAGSAAGASLATILPQAQLFSSINGGPVFDWLTHNSPIAGILNGTETVGEWANRMGAEINRNAATFADNWDPNSPNGNVIAKFFGGRNANQDAADRLGTSNWLPSYMGGGIGNGSTKYDEAASKMERAAEDLVGGSNSQKQSSTELTAAADSMKGLPALIESAVERGMSRVTIVVDVDTVANAVTPRVGSNMAAVYRATMK